jgi:hypothetical protein
MQFTHYKEVHRCHKCSYESWGVGHVLSNNQLVDPTARAQWKSATAAQRSTWFATSSHLSLEGRTTAIEEVVTQSDTFDASHGSSHAGTFKSEGQLLTEMCPWIPGTATPTRDTTRMKEFQYLVDNARGYYDSRRGCQMYEDSSSSIHASTTALNHSLFSRQAQQGHNVSAPKAKALARRAQQEVATPKASAVEVDELLAAAYPTPHALRRRELGGPKAAGKAKALSKTTVAQLEKLTVLLTAAVARADIIFAELTDASRSELMGGQVPPILVEGLRVAEGNARRTVNAMRDTLNLGTSASPGADLAAYKAILSALLLALGELETMLARIRTLLGLRPYERVAEAETEGGD